MTCSQGDSGAARALYRESLALPRDVGEKSPIVGCLEGIAATIGAQEQPARAARLFGAAEALRHQIGSPLSPADRAQHERQVAAVRASLGEEAFATTWAEGRAMGLEEAVTAALAEVNAEV